MLLCLLALAVVLTSGAGESSGAPVHTDRPEPARERVDRTPGTCDGKRLVFHVHRARVLIRRAFDVERWSDSTPAKGSEKRAWQKHRRCIRADKTRRQISDYRHTRKSRFLAYRADRLAEQREQEQLAALTPYGCGAHGSFAIPCYIVGRESGFNARAKNPSSSAGGYYQILNTTWAGAGGQPNGCYHVAACASEEEQHAVASRLWAGGAGASHWALTL